MLGAGLLLAGASLLTGALLGFVFGIPKTRIRSDSRKEPYQPNTSLEEISDWLTKLLLGAGLAQAIRLPAGLRSLGEYLATALSLDGAAAVLTAFVIWHVISGFFLSYLATRTLMPAALSRAHYEIGEPDAAPLASELHAAAQGQLAEDLDRRGNFTAAVAAYLNAYRLDGKRVDLLIAAAMLRSAKLNDYEGADFLLKMALASHPHHPQTFFHLAANEVRRQDLDTAIDYLDRAAAAEPGRFAHLVASDSSFDPIRADSRFINLLDRSRSTSPRVEAN